MSMPSTLSQHSPLSRISFTGISIDTVFGKKLQHLKNLWKPITKYIVGEIHQVYKEKWFLIKLHLTRTMLPNTPYPISNLQTVIFFMNQEEVVCVCPLTCVCICARVCLCEISGAIPDTTTFIYYRNRQVEIQEDSQILIKLPTWQVLMTDSNPAAFTFFKCQHPFVLFAYSLTDGGHPMPLSKEENGWNCFL